MLLGLAAVLFYIFSFIMIVSAFLVIMMRNPVHSVLFLILTFFNAAILFLFTGAEFLAMLLLVVYVGAVAVLFLFVVMMLDVDIIRFKQSIWRYAPIGFGVGLVALVELIFVFYQQSLDPIEIKNGAQPIVEGISNTMALGNILYTNYVFYFELAAFILLVAMIGAIVLTLHKRTHVRRQNVSEQVARTVEKSIEIKKVASGKGLQG